MDIVMDVFADTCAMASPVTSSVVTTSEPSMTEIGFEGGQDDFGLPFFDPSSIKKEGYEEKQPPFYDGSSDSYLPPYPSTLKTENVASTGGLVSPQPAVAILQQHSTYHRSLNIVYEQKNLSPESSSPNSRQVGRHKNNGSERQFTAADSNSGSPKSPVPCKVCGDKASGYHYGVTSCEGCKGFFRRSIQKQIEYRCLRDGKCMVIRLNRNRCQFCRFKKCLAVGMSKDSVRYGRVPKRSRERNEDTRVTQSEADQSNQIPENKENKEVAMYDLVLSISQAHHTNCAYTEEKTRGLVRKPAIFMNDFQSNGNEGQTVDSLEQQKLVMWQQFASFLTPSIQRIVEFAKHVPGFLDLTQDDQLILIKLGFFEIWLVHIARMVDTLDNTLTFCDGSYVSRQQMEFMFDHDFVSVIFSFIAPLNGLQLSDTEIGLYSAIVLFTSERSGIYDHKAIEQQREKFMEALKFQLNRNHPSAPHLFATLVMKLPELRSIGEKHMDHLRWFRANWMHLKLPPLFAELFDIPRSEQDLAQRYYKS